jgi:hypothetical protein
MCGVGRRRLFDIDSKFKGREYAADAQQAPAQPDSGLRFDLTGKAEQSSR